MCHNAGHGDSPFINNWFMGLFNPDSDQLWKHPAGIGMSWIQTYNLEVCSTVFWLLHHQSTQTPPIDESTAKLNLSFDFLYH